jgi:hypothetical protein
MAEMNDFDIEIQDEKDSTPEHFNGNVASAGTSVPITPTSGKDIQLAYIKNPNRGDNKNEIADVLYINIDGGSEYTTLSRGEYVYLPGTFTTLKIDSNNNGTNYEVIVWS